VRRVARPRRSSIGKFGDPKRRLFQKKTRGPGDQTKKNGREWKGQKKFQKKKKLGSENAE